MSEKETLKETAFFTLTRYPNGLAVRELAEKLGIDRRRLDYHLAELADEGKVYREGRQWFAHPEALARLRRLEVSPEEVMTFYLATRLFVKQHDKQNRVAHVALLKLAKALSGEGSGSDEIAQTAEELAQRPDDGAYSYNYRMVMQAYIYRRRLMMKYAPIDRDPFDTVFEPYLLEPSAIGFCTYVIGYSHLVKDIRTYKLERIRSASLLTGQENTYVIPSTFPGLAILKNAWTIYHGKKTQPVVLRFSEAVRQRVEETRWHPSEEKTPDPEKPGWLRWTAHIADLTDIRPWVRGWGAECEVIAPEALLNELKRESKRLAFLYQTVMPTQIPAHRLLWAKADKETGAIHRLIYHMIDVGQVALALWDEALPDNLKAQFAQWVSLSVEDAGRLVAFWAALHDLGKANPDFQGHPRLRPASLKSDLRREQEAAGLKWNAREYAEVVRHELVSAWALSQQESKGGLLASETGLATPFVYQVAQALGGHHGAWPKSDALDAAQLPRDRIGVDDAWNAARRELMREMMTIFKPPHNLSIELELTHENTLLTLFSALTSVADWIGSDETLFPLKESQMGTADYAELSASCAAKAVRKLGWLAKPVLTGLVSFENAFERNSVRPVQAEAIRATESLPAPALVILEAPTGIGKTEVALYLADRWAQNGAHTGVYVAMPTTATSNQMHDRARGFLLRRYGSDAKPLLVHSRALLEEKGPADDGEPVEDTPGDRVAAVTWFLPRKRSLLARFGVGTVDQALMSVLQTKHFFVRLLGLSHKVVIFDEVHAYDAYMGTLFKRLLAWLRELGTSVIILSATLPERTRREFTAAYLGIDEDELTLPRAAYPRLICAAKDGLPFAVSLMKPDDTSLDKTLELKWIERDPASVVEQLRQALSDPETRCAAVICNRVERAQEVYAAVKAAFENECDVTLFHAQFPYLWREQKESDVLGKFGPPDDPSVGRPHKGIVVATQVIEQSLDLDFDVMISDLAPVDLLIQRAGRLQRHDRKYSRPPYRLLITQPELGGHGLPDFGKDKYVYDRHPLLATWFALRARPSITLPRETETLIEQVYGDTLIPDLTGDEQAALAQALDEMIRKQEEAERKAREKLVLAPEKDTYLSHSGLALDEDNPEMHAAFQALTRKDEPGVQVVCLHQTLNGWAVDPDNPRETLVDPYQPDTPEKIQLLLKGVISIRRWEVKKHFLATDAPDAWRKIPALRHHRLAVFIEGGVYDQIESCQLKLSREFGLQFIPKRSDDEQNPDFFFQLD